MQAERHVEMKKNDWKLIAFLLAAAGICFLVYRMGGKGGGEAVIYQNGSEYARIALSTEQEIRIGQTNTLVVEQGKVRMKEADCPDQICVKHRPVSRTGESIVCLPNRIVVEIQGGPEKHTEQQEKPDVTAY